MTPSSRSHLVVGAVIPALVLIAMSMVHVLAGYSDVPRFGNAWGMDDAYISYRYAHNLSIGHGLVYNSGERVEGYSNLLYILLLTPSLLFLGPAKIYAVAVGLNLVLVLVVFVLFRRRVEQALGRRESLLAAWLLALLPPIWVSVASGLETCLILALLVALWIAVEKVASGDRRRLGVLCLLIAGLILSRADGFLFPGIAVLYLLLQRRRREAAIAAAALVATMGAYCAWRYAYYGYFLPNTYYVKVDGPLGERLVRAGKQLASVFFVRGALAAYPLAFIWLLWGVWRAIRTEGTRAIALVRFEVIASILWIAYWFFIGGDALGERFLIILMLFWILAFARGVAQKLEGPTLAYFLVLLVVVQLGALPRDQRFQYTRDKYDCWLTLGEFLARHHPTSVLAIDSAGKAPFVSGLRTIDMLGLNDEHIAHLPLTRFTAAGHNKWDTDYVISRRPDLIGAWIVSDRMDMHWGLTRDRYEAAGYELKYLLRTRLAGRAEPVMEASTMDAKDLILARDDGYAYGVLAVKRGAREAAGSLEKE